MRTDLHPYRAHHEITGAFSALDQEVLGHTVEGRPIHAVTFGPRDAAHVSVVLAGIHAMEWIGVECALALIRALALDPPRDRRIVVVPVVNVDGYHRVEGDLRRGERRFRRGNAHGVDLNRNWPTHFRAPRLLDRVVPIWNPGPRACSEPEIAAVVSRLEAEVARGARITHALSLHSFGEKVLFPYGGLWRPAEDRHRAAASALRFRISTPYEVVQSSRWVPGMFGHGMELDHLCDGFGAISALIECSPGGARLADPSTWLDPFRWFNPVDPRPVVAALLPAIEWFVRAESAAGRGVNPSSPSPALTAAVVSRKEL